MKYFIIVLLVISLGCYGPKKVVINVPPGLPEAPTGFDLLTNGLVDQTRHDDDRAQFEEPAVLPELGPNYNARACAHCHDTPVTGASSQVFEHRTNDNARLVHDRSTNPEGQQRANFGDINALRPSLSLMGDGFVEQVPDSLLKDIARQNGGQFIEVPFLEMPNVFHVGRFGIKDQHSSLLSFAGDADFNEKGVGNRLLPDPDNGIEDQEPSCGDGQEDIDCYARFMRALKAPSRGPVTPTVEQGEKVFDKIGCVNCHVDTLFTDKVQFHPYGDYLLHDIGTGDGIAQGLAPANKVRTLPLWGLRARARFMHDGRALDVRAAINDHKEEARRARRAFNGLNAVDKANVLAFLNSL
jgi:CxxC motif-containing protein (DUF1111 family)